MLRLPYRLYRRGRGWLRAFARRRPFISGLPPGLDKEELDRVCRQATGRGLRSASYAHLSGWKDSGAYRLSLRLEGFRFWLAIYKLSVYGQDQIPALQGFPARVGPPEYTVYSHGSSPLSRFLPEVYVAHEVEPGCCYRYVLEDLYEKYQVLPNRRGLEAITPLLPMFHQALQEWGQQVDLDRFIRYDAGFSHGLRTYAEAALAEFASEYPDSYVGQWLQSWPRVAELHADPGFDPYDRLQPIHGDLNLRNVVFGRRDTSSFKLLDWEWAGWGRPLADLASVVKHMHTEQAEWAFETYAEAAKLPDIREARRRFYWECLERGLIDAAFMAKQIVEMPPKTRMNVFGFLDNSLRQVTDSCRALEGDAFLTPEI